MDGASLPQPQPPHRRSGEDEEGRGGRRGCLPGVREGGGQYEAPREGHRQAPARQPEGLEVPTSALLPGHCLPEEEELHRGEEGARQGGQAQSQIPRGAGEAGRRTLLAEGPPGIPGRLRARPRAQSRLPPRGDEQVLRPHPPRPIQGGQSVPGAGAEARPQRILEAILPHDRCGDERPRLGKDLPGGERELRGPDLHLPGIRPGDLAEHRADPPGVRPSRSGSIRSGSTRTAKATSRAAALPRQAATSIPSSGSWSSIATPRRRKPS